MDGPTSRLPSSSVASVATANFAARRSVKDSFNSAPVTPTSNSSYVDPPRPAKEGYEWVWFPAGYWAEREVVEAPGKVMKHFKWRKRSGKSSSGRATEDEPDHLWDHTQRIFGHPSLPNSFIAEEGRGQSPQRPHFNRHGTSSESGGSSFPLLRTPQAELPSPYLTEEAHVQSLQRSPLSHPMNSQTNSSESGTSLLKPTKPLQSSPLTIEKGDTDTTTTPIPTSINIPISQAGTSLSSFMHISPMSPDNKPKKSFIARLLPEHRPKMKKMHSDDDAYNYTMHTLEGARAQLLTHQSQCSTPIPIMSRVASLLLREEGAVGGGKRAWSRSFKLFGKSPWHWQASAGSETSASSSLRDVLRGRTPVGSPVSDVEPLKSHCVQFPGGEARRIKTPPLRESGLRRDRPRSFFFDIATPSPRSDGHSNGNNGSSSCSSSGEWRSRHQPRSPPPTARILRDDEGGSGGRDANAGAKDDDHASSRRKKRESTKEWWEVPVAVPRYEAMAPASFEFDMPEHLPSSPMCPTNARHKSGGTGVCVYHGRRKRGGGGGREGDEERSEDEDEDADVWT